MADDSSYNADTGNVPKTGRWDDAGCVSVAGLNPSDFLQGYLTCDLTRLQREDTLPMALCNLKGRVIVSGWVQANSDGSIDLIVHRSLTQRLVDVLTPYARFSRCVLSIKPTTLCVEQLEQGGIAGKFHLCDEQTELGPDLSEHINRALIEHGFAWVTEPTSEKFLPQVLDLHNQNAVDFDKGCYLGQEIVARAQFRGQVKRGLVAFTYADDQPSPGSENKEGQIVIAVTASGDFGPGAGLAVG